MKTFNRLSTKREPKKKKLLQKSQEMKSKKRTMKT
jgi:hypothetical protein